MADDITLAELLAAFKEAGFSGSEDSPGKTAKELAESWKCSEQKAKKQLERAKAAGYLRVGSRMIVRIDNKPGVAPVYSFVFPVKKGRKR